MGWGAELRGAALCASDVSMLGVSGESKSHFAHRVAWGRTLCAQDVSGHVFALGLGVPPLCGWMGGMVLPPSHVLRWVGFVFLEGRAMHSD